MYYNKVKYTGYGALGLTEGKVMVALGQFGLMLCLVVTGVFGQDFWTPSLKLICNLPIIASYICSNR